MVPVKSSGSSCHKGKDAIYDPPVEQETVEEDVYSELDHSDEEETRRDPDSECALLIDPWYDVYPSFLKIPGDYVPPPPPPSHVWLALCQRNLNTSWAPVSSSIYDLVIRQGISLPVPIHFEFGLGITQGWKELVNSELSDTGFVGLLQRVGVPKAIVLSRSLSNFRDLYNFCHLVHRWCATTHTSSFPVANSPSPLKTWLTNYFYRFLVTLILPP